MVVVSLVVVVSIFFNVVVVGGGAVVVVGGFLVEVVVEMMEAGKVGLIELPPSTVPSETVPRICSGAFSEPTQSS